MSFNPKIVCVWLLLWPAIVCAQSDSIAADQWLEKIEQQTELKLAYDVQLMSSRKVEAQYSVSKTSLILWLQQNGFCYQEPDSNHLLIFPCAISPWSLKAEVLDPATDERLPFATIQLIGTDRTTSSNQHGWFNLDNIITAEAQIAVSYIGYHTDTLTVDRSTSIERVELLPRSFLLSIAEIEQTIDVIKGMQQYSAIALETDYLKSMPSIGEPDPISSVRLLPGIGGNPESSSGISMRGGRFDQSLILYDDFQLLHMDHFFGLFSTVNHQNVKDIRIHRGGYSAKHSGFVNGMIQLTGKEGNLNEPAVGVSSNTLTSGLYVEFPVIKKKWSTNLSFRRDNSWMGFESWNQGLALRVIEQELTENAPNISDLSDTESTYFFNDFSFKTVYWFNDRSKLSFSYLRSQDELQNNINFSDPARAYSLRTDLFSIWINEGFSLAWNHQSGKRFLGKLSFAATTFFSETEFPIVLEVLGTDTLQNQQNFSRENSLGQMRLRYDAEIPLPKDFKLWSGVELPYIHSILDAQDDGSSIRLNDSVTLAAGYVELERQNDQWHWRAGARVSYNDRTENTLFQPRLFASYAFAEHWTTRLNMGRYYQFIQQFAPSSREGLVPDYWLLPNFDHVQPIHSDQVTLGASYQRSQLLIDAELYYKAFDHLIEQFPDVSRLYNAASNPLAISSEASGEVSGIDLFISNRFKRLTTWAGADLALVRNEADSIASRYQPYYANQGSVKFGGLYKWKNFELSSSFTVLGGRGLTVVDQNSNLNTIEIGANSLDTYHRLDFAVNYAFNWKKINGLIRNTFFNVYNRNNIRTVNYVQSAQNAQIPRGVQSNNLGFFYNVGFELHF